MDRETALKLARDAFEEPLWLLMVQLERTLKGLLQTAHFDLNDSTAVGAALHGSLPQAYEAAKLFNHDLSLEYCRNGPCYKIGGRFQCDEVEHTVSMELHFAGPRGHTSKMKHQFATSDVEGAPELPGFAAAAPESLLLFVAYHLDGAKTFVNKLFLMFADGVDRKKVQLHRSEVATLHEIVVAPAPNSNVPSTMVKIKKAGGEAADHVGKTDKRGDAASSS